MNNDAEAMKQLFAWLLQEPDPAISAPSGNRSSHETSPEESGLLDSQATYFDPLDSDFEGVDALSADSDESSLSRFRQISSLEFGDIPAVQDRFQALLRRRLRAEIERNPPLFPWETGSFDYESEYTDVSAPELIPVPLWATQLQTLNLPVPVPEQVLAQLFEHCRTVVQSSLQEGVKLVQAVEAFFPGQFQALNQLAGLVLSMPARSGQLTTNLDSAQFPRHYDVATPTQQMALSLLAAKEILEAMTLKLSPRQPLIERIWVTDLGSIRLNAMYQPEMGQIRIQGTLPGSGCLCFRNGEDRSIAQSIQAGSISVELLDLEPNQTYFLEVQLGESEQPLVFAVCPTNEG